MSFRKMQTKLETIAQQERYKGDFPREISVRQFTPSVKTPDFKAHTNLRTKETEISYNPDYAEENSQKTEVIVRDVSRHEINHHRYKGFNGCPRNLDNAVELIFEPIYNTISNQGYSQQDASYMENTLEDTILHTDLSRGNSLEGIAAFFDNVGTHSQKFTKFYEAHVKLNMMLMGSKKQRRSMGKFYTHQEEITEVLKSFLERTGLSGLTQEVGHTLEKRDGKLVKIGGKTVKDRQKIRDFLNDENNWPEIARIYAEEFSKLLEPNYAMPIFNHSGAGTNGRESEDASNEGNEFDAEMNTRAYKAKRVKQADADKENVPKWINPIEALDILYESLAQRLEINAEVFTRTDTMPILWYSNRPFDPEKDDFKRVSFGFDDHGDIELRKKRFHEDIPLEVKVSERGFPKARFVMLDTSGTMSYAFDGSRDIGNTKIVPWGDKSRYHGALVEFWGFLEYLKQNHLLNQTAIDLASFDSETFIGRGLTKAKEIALRPRFGGDTRIELDKIQEMFEGRGSLIFTICDGAVYNWDKIKKDFIAAASKHAYFHLQIGELDTTSRQVVKDLKESGFHIEHIKTAQDLRGRVVDLTDSLLRSRQ
jgi:hypothetical protein